MLGNSASFEDSFTTCQITPENHGSLLDSLFNMQLASRNPFSGQSVSDCLFLARFTDPPPSTCTLTFARYCAELSRNFRENIPIHRPRPSAAGGTLKEKRTPGALVFGSRKASLLETWLFLETSRRTIRQWQRQVQGCASGPWCLAVCREASPLEARLLLYQWLSKSTTTQGTEPEPNRNSPVPFSRRTPGGSGWQPFT